jgi:hypothetical protein
MLAIVLDVVALLIVGVMLVVILVNMLEIVVIKVGYIVFEVVRNIIRDISSVSINFHLSRSIHNPRSIFNFQSIIHINIYRIKVGWGMMYDIGITSVSPWLTSKVG